MKQKSLSSKLCIQIFIIRKRMTKFLFLSLALALLSSTIKGETEAGQFWKPLPLRSQAQAQAGMSGGEGMQRIWSISYAPITPSNPDGNIAYFLSNTSGVWKSTDGGNFWESKRGYYDVSSQQDKGFRSTGGYSIVVDPSNENVVFVSSSSFNSIYTEVDGIYRTVDGGNSWDMVRQVRYDGGNLEGQHFVFDPTSLDQSTNRHMTVYAVTHHEGILKSEDGGDTWPQTISVGTIDTRIYDLEIHRVNENYLVLYAATSSGLYKIVDDGTITVSAIGNLPDYPRTIALDPKESSDDDIIYAAVGTYKVYKSTDGGQTIDQKSGTSGAELPASNYNTIDIHKANSNYLFVTKTSGNICEHPYYSHDGGETWLKPSNLNVDDLFFENYTINNGTQLCSYGATIATHPVNQEIALYDMAGIFKTSDAGDTWRYSGNGYMGGRRGPGKTSAYVDPLNPDRKLFFLTDYSVAETLDNGSTWELLFVYGTTPVGTGDPDDSDAIITARGSWYSQVINRGTYDDVTGDWTWTKFDGYNSVPDTTGNYRFMSYHPQDPNFIYAGAIDGSWISTDDGVTWTGIENMSIRAVYPGNGDIVYAFEKCDTENPFQGCTGSWTSSIIISRGELQHQPPNQDEIIWEKLSVAPFGMSGLNDIDIDHFNSNRLYVATSIGFYIFDADCFDPSAGCNVWKETGGTGGMEPDLTGKISVQAVVADPVDPDIIYAGLRSGYGHREKIIYRSDDGGLNWNNIVFGGGYSGVWSLSIEVDPVTQKSILHMSTSHGNYVLCTDTDNDGYAVEGGACGLADCDDNNAAINPDANDTNCNGIDENCSGTADEGYVPTATTCGVGACAATGQLICVNGSLSDTCTPGTPGTEGLYGDPTCSDSVDNDCDGLTDTDDTYCRIVDLVVADISNSATAVSGGSFTVTDTVFNQGGTGTGSGFFFSHYYLSTDTLKDDSDTDIGNRKISDPIAPAGSSTGTKTFNLPPGITPGIYYLLVCADYPSTSSRIAESDETNNCLVSQTQVQVTQ